MVTDGNNNEVFTVKGSGETRINYTDDLTSAFVIGNTNHSYDIFRVLDNGNVYATEVNVRVKADFPDYVF